MPTHVSAPYEVRSRPWKEGPTWNQPSRARHPGKAGSVEEKSHEDKDTASGDSQSVAGAGAHRGRGRYGARDALGHVRGHPLARGTTSEIGAFQHRRGQVPDEGPVLLATNSVTIQPGGSSGWHFHPGVTLVSVAAGTVVRYDAHCMATVFPPVPRSSSRATTRSTFATRGTVPAVNIVTFIVPAGTTNMGLRIDAPAPGCDTN